MISMMTTESDSIPYEGALVRAERLLVLAPHPDDEVIGCGGLLASHLLERRRVSVAIVTDGAAAEREGIEVEEYRRRRQLESQRGLAILGEPVDIRFLGFPDRSLEERQEELRDALRALLVELSPDLIAVPSPIEIHPDHLALSRAFCELMQRDPSLFADLATARVFFYEVSQPIRPNVLVDISATAEAKYAAIAAHESQLQVRDYIAFARGLNAYRAMTLPPGTRYAEAYWAIDLPRLHTTSWSRLQQDVGGAPRLTVEREHTPVTVVVRTRNRPHLLKEALSSIKANPHPHEIIVVNDGGQTPGDLGDAKLVEHATSLGRAAAANAGATVGTCPFLAFLDDDDLYYPEHLPTLSRAAANRPQHAAWYTDAVSAFLSLGPTGDLVTTSRQRIFSEDFDRDLLLIDNHIPLPSLLFRRDRFLELGGFDVSFELFEDWDFLLRLANDGDFTHVPLITCEIRHFSGSDSITLANPEGSASFREAKKKIWEKHRSRLTEDVFANAFEGRKQRLVAARSELVEEKGRRHHSQIAIQQLLREKDELIGKIQLADAINREAALRLAALEPQIPMLIQEKERVIADAVERAVARELDVKRALDAAGRDLAENQTTIAALYAEVHRLQSMLDTIFQSRTWKLHTIVEKVKGR
jgi:LmbE family N-acetylglucosaminyl deacetylase